mmetsp:Transcript_690/g.1351  ORF Transcript_690/g.1351 Transcript_690/m.1351 type:complete len:117 (-) Transcript_690:295-645(-)
MFLRHSTDMFPVGRDCDDYKGDQSRPSFNEDATIEHCACGRNLLGQRIDDPEWELKPLSTCIWGELRKCSITTPSASPTTTAVSTATISFQIIRNIEASFFYRMIVSGCKSVDIMN